MYTRNHGLSAPISPVRHPFFERWPDEKHVLIAFQGGNGGPPNSRAAIQAAARLHERMIIWVDVQMTASGTLIALHETMIGAPSQQKPTLVAFMDDADLGVGDKILTLAEAIRVAPDHRYVLNVREYRPTLDQALVQVVDEANAAGRVLIQSESDGLLRDVRALRATWLFGTSQAQITQLLMLVPFGLESVAPLKGDVYVTPAVRDGVSLVKPEVITEVHRRGRRVFAGPVNNAAEGESLLSRGVDGLITSQPELFLDVLSQPPAAFSRPPGSSPSEHDKQAD